MSKQTTFTPGKLYITGEYFVVHGDANALIVPLKNGITVNVEKSDTYEIYIDKYKKSYPFKPLEQYHQLPNTIIQSTLKTVYQLLDESNKPYHPIYIHLESSLDSSQGISYGLGSSGAVVIALIKALTMFYQLSLSKMALFKIGVISQLEEIEHSSFGDFATSAFESKISYHIFDKEWLKNQSKKSITALYQKHWRGLAISKVELNIPYHLVVNTGIKANSYLMVNRFNKKIQSSKYHQLKKEYKLLEREFMASKNIYMLEDINNIYKRIDQAFNIGIFIEEFYHIEQVAKKHNGISKFSGAGGGDNIILYFQSDEDRTNCYEDLISHNYHVFKDLILE